MLEIKTQRLRLIVLTSSQLSLYVPNPQELEEDLGFSVSRDIVTDPLRRAIGMKLSKMALAKTQEHPWYTYWLIVIADEPYGAGLAGFKGPPNERGEVEIGYGIDPAYQNKGYITEAARGLINWAFRHPECKSVVAIDTKKSNIASNRVLKKLGMWIYGETDEALDWRLDRVRPLKASDKKEWGRLRVALWPDCPPERHEREMEGILHNPEREIVFVSVRADGCLQGFVEVRIRSYADGCETNHVGYLEGWYVESDVRKQGLGRALVAAAEEWARSKGCQEMASDTPVANRISQDVHKRLGYETVDQLVHFRKDLKAE